MIQRAASEAASISERFLGIVMRQTEETTKAGEAALKLVASAKAWRAASDDAAAVEAIERLESLDDRARWQMRRAFMLALELGREAALDPFPKLAEDLRAAEMKPLPKRPFPPYPQVFHLVASNPLWSREQCAAMAAIDRLREEPDARATLDAELMRLWQLGDRPDHEDALDAALADWLMPTLARVNDDFANAVHIDPRFANFIPFVALAREQCEDKLEGPKRAALRALAHYHGECAALYQHFGQDRDYALGGERLEALRQRLTLGSPKLAQIAEAKLGATPLRLVIALILARLEVAFARWSGTAEAFDADTPRISPLWSKQALEGVEGYGNAASLLRDLKHLHQAVGELYGGVALAPLVRRLLMTCGAHGFFGSARELRFSALRIVGDLSELAMRAGVISDPIDALEGEAQAAALEAAFGAIPKLAEWTKASSLSNSLRELFALMARIRSDQREFDADASSLMVIEDCVQSADALMALLLLRIDQELEKGESRRQIGRPLVETISLAPEFASTLSADQAAAALGEILTHPLYQGYLASRGGHSEVALARELERTPMAAAWHAEATMLLMLDRARAADKVLTFVLDDEALASFPAAALNSLVRLRSTFRLETTLLRPALAEAKMRASLDSVTRAIYLQQESSNAGAYRALLRALAQSSEEIAETCYQQVAQASSGKVERDALVSWTQPWLGSLNALAAFLDGRLDFEGAPETSEARLALVRAALLESPRFAQLLRSTSEWLGKNDRRVLSLQAFRTLPKASYGVVFPIIEKALLEATAVLAKILPAGAKAPAAKALEDALWLLELAEYER